MNYYPVLLNQPLIWWTIQFFLTPYSLWEGRRLYFVQLNNFFFSNRLKEYKFFIFIFTYNLGKKPQKGYFGLNLLFWVPTLLYDVFNRIAWSEYIIIHIIFYKNLSWHYILLNCKGFFMVEEKVWCPSVVSSV